MGKSDRNAQEDGGPNRQKEQAPARPVPRPDHLRNGARGGPPYRHRHCVPAMHSLRTREARTTLVGDSTCRGGAAFKLIAGHAALAEPSARERKPGPLPPAGCSSGTPAGVPRCSMGHRLRLLSPCSYSCNSIPKGGETAPLVSTPTRASRIRERTTSCDLSVGCSSGATQKVQESRMNDHDNQRLRSMVEPC